MTFRERMEWAFRMALLAFILTATGIANAFFWTYWTLAYLRLSGRGGGELPATAA